MIDYKKSFEKLVEQIKFENELACNDAVNIGVSKQFQNGMMFAYNSIRELAEKLEKGEFEFEEEAEGA